MGTSNSTRREQLVSAETYENNYEGIFGSDKTRKARIAARPKTARKRVREVNAPNILKPIVEFTSDVDGTRISDRSQLREHNKKHGVTDSRDYSPEYREKADYERQARLHLDTPQDKRERKEALARAFEGTL